MLFGVDVVWVGTLLAVVAAGLMIGVNLALTIRDPMAKRVKALNERREELKAGIVAINPKKRAQLVRRSEATDRIRTILNRINGLQDSQIQAAQQSWRRPASARRKWPLR
jgi:tight adherence protein C